MDEDVVTIYTYMHHRTLLSYERKEIMSFAATWMDLEMIILSEVNQKENVKYHMISLYVDSKIRHKSTYLQNKNTENKLVVAKGEREWGHG